MSSSSTRKRRVYLLYTYFAVGGIETLIIRVSRWLVCQGWDVVVCCEKFSDFAKELPVGVKTVELGQGGYLRPKLVCQVFKSLGPADLLWSFSPTTSVAAHSLVSVGRATAVIHGVYNPWSYRHPAKGVRQPLQLYKAYLFKKVFVPSDVWFMSEVVRIHHQASYKTSLDDTRVWPLPMEHVDIRKQPDAPPPLRIVSIGRFSYFKGYHVYMPKIIRSLLDRGYQVIWDVYGSFDSRIGEASISTEMERAVAENGVQDNVFFHGDIPYSDLRLVFRDAHVFVGMGTALLDAASAGVPSIPAIVNDRSGYTYGWISELPIGCVGESIPDRQPHVLVEELLIQVLEMGREDYAQLSWRCHHYMRLYDIDKLMAKVLLHVQSPRPAEWADARALRQWLIFCTLTKIARLKGRGVRAMRRFLASVPFQSIRKATSL